LNAQTLVFSRWLIATRPQFLTAMALPVLFGSALAWREGHAVAPWPLLLALVAALLLHAVANLVNDIVDHRRGADPLNTDPLTPFAGGSRVIQKGLLTEAQMVRLAAVLLAISLLLGLLLVALVGWPLLWIGVAGVLIGLAYSAGPWPLNYHAMGEPAVAVTFGLLAVTGSYFTQAQGFSLAAWVAGLPVGLLVAALLLVNEFPDAPSDQQAGKKTWVVWLGPERARLALGGLLVGAFALTGLLVGLGAVPTGVLLGLLALPLAVFGWLRTPAVTPDKRERLVGMKAVIGSHALFTALATLGLLLFA